MKIFYILWNICFPYYNFVIPIYIKTNGSISMFYFVVPISSPINSVCGFISKCYILDISSSGAGITSIFSCSWIPFGFFSSWPPPLRSYGISSCTSFWIVPLLRSCNSLVCISSSWTVPLRLASVSSSWPNTSIFVGLPQMKFKNILLISFQLVLQNSFINFMLS